MGKLRVVALYFSSNFLRVSSVSSPGTPCLTTLACSADTNARSVGVASSLGGLEPKQREERHAAAVRVVDEHSAEPNAYVSDFSSVESSLSS